jgi:hypothetical protein
MLLYRRALMLIKANRPPDERRPIQLNLARRLLAF